MTSNEHLTMGEATQAVQGYPTQIWIPHEVKNPQQTGFALIHDRRNCDTDNDIFFIPGNSVKKLILPGSEVYTFTHEGRVRNLRIPDALLWKNHGGPCENRGARYRRVSHELTDRALKAFELEGGNRPVILSQESLHTNHDYMGPGDYSLTDEEGKSATQLSLHLMNLELLAQYR